MSEAKGSSGGFLGFLRETAIVLVGALIASTLLRLFLVQVFVIPSRSMEDTLRIGDRVAVQKVQPYERGDVVVFRDALEWLGNPDRTRLSWWQEALTFVGLLPDESANHLVKRVVGLPGDHVTCCDSLGRLSVNGVAVDEAGYLYADAATGESVKPSDFPFDVVVPAGRLFVMGDHRDNSADSRCHLDEAVNGVEGAGAFVPTDAVVGTTVAVLFPFDRWQGFSTPDSFDVVPPSEADPPAAPVIRGPRVPC